MLKIQRLCLALAILTYGHASAATEDPPVEFSSGNQQVTLIELFTSEGCSSCPPADRWLSKLKDDPKLWNEFVPLAFHVDYWDYIGWKDAFAQPEFTDRQRRNAADSGAVVYTPGFFRNGSEWLGWRRGASPADLSNNVGELHVRIEGENVTAQFNPVEYRIERLTLHIAILGMNLETEVRAGENKGRTLHHDFVVLNVTSTSLQNSGAGYQAALEIADFKRGAAERAIAAWVSGGRTQSPIQSAGSFLPPH